MFFNAKDKEETNRIFKDKHFEELYFDEQQKAIAKDRKYNYVHVLLEIYNMLDRRFEKYKESLKEIQDRYFKTIEKYKKAFIENNNTYAKIQAENEGLKKALKLLGIKYKNIFKEDNKE